MSTTVKAVTARIPHACDSCYVTGSRSESIAPGHRYLQHVAFPDGDINHSHRPHRVTECVACAYERDYSAGEETAACASFCCGDVPCARPPHRHGDHSCRRCMIATVPPPRERIQHRDGVYTARRDPEVRTIWKDDGPAVLVCYTHQLTESTMNRAWREWLDILGYRRQLPPPRLHWMRIVPCAPGSYEADEGLEYLYRPANPGKPGAFPVIEFPEAWNRPPYMIDVHLPEVVPT